MDGYEWDVFISYRRYEQWKLWLDKFFVPFLERALQPELRTNDKDQELPGYYYSKLADMLETLCNASEPDEIFRPVKRLPSVRRVFVTGVTREMHAYRRVVVETLLKSGIEVVMQEEFGSAGQSTMEKIRSAICQADAVILLMGKVYGGSSNEEHGKSFTQVEYEFARQVQKPIFCFLLADDRSSPEQDSGHLTKGLADGSPVDQGSESARRQMEFISQMKDASIYQSFANASDLRVLVHKIDLEPEFKPQNLPSSSLGNLFQGRELFINRLRSSLFSETGVAGSNIAIVHGLGGVGKTRAAIEYAYKYAVHYSALLFVHAANSENLDRGLADLTGPTILNLPEYAEREQSVRVSAVMRWLKAHTAWLMILDDVDTSETAQAVSRMLVGLNTGHVVITSRSATWPPQVTELALDVLDTNATTEFLLERTKGKRRPVDTDYADAGELAKDLGGLALAMEQAGAFVSTHRVSLAEYRKRLNEQERKTLEWFDPRAMNYPRSVATTLQTATAQLGQSGRDLLNILCWLAPAPVSLGMLQQIVAPVTHDFDLNSALADLMSYSLANQIDDAGSIVIHRLVSSMTRSRLSEPERKEHLQIALAMLDKYCVGDPADVRSWSVYDAASEHLTAVLSHADQAGIYEPTSRLMIALAVYLEVKAEFSQAETLMRRAMMIVEANAGAAHPSIARTLYHLARLLLTTNRLSEAEPLMRRALAIDEAGYGNDHPNVAIDLNNLAQLLKATNRVSEAEPLMRRALSIDEASHGKDHPNVAIRINNLASLLQATNRLAEAEPLMRRVLQIFESSYGQDHPNVATALNNMAQLLQDTNRLSEAELLMRRALAIDEASYDKDHPNVARDLNNLATLLQATNRLAEAEPLMRRALAIDEASYGEDHPDVARDLNNQARLLQATNRLAEAEPLMRRALASYERSFGPDHPTVATSLNDLAQLLQTTKRLGEAESLYRRALAINEKSLGPDHPNVATSLNDLAELLQVTNRFAEAELLMRRALTIDERSFGSDHPNVAADLNNLASLLRATNRVAEAEPLMRRALAIDERSLGPNPSDVARDLSNLAQLLEATNRLGEAESSSRQSTAALVARRDTQRQRALEDPSQGI